MEILYSIVIAQVSVERISPEAPIPVLKLSKENKEILGGSGNVARNICAAETKCHLISVIGDDNDSKKLFHYVRKLKVYLLI